ncbi:hypothetical protein COT97_01190 [Candidatus Falkowbacteria bacterium CG10_big_fil_rev_8_21_14_0_10_39_11]|uniref:Uncharacterized protein n=1 Tax=Candidatus Falkowbacteria bacterium CG10_big_fil_rev_8_21_14_0_10_39_11 TaxID=1974565 RepID=A0A2H0V5W3_9BACT|nr:MAG: hypothetical protein COT97_01190 [Candidatus Falkowbacteria bacterium CG10_big_fil_rev_8_21_14_0_10_39_11]
MTQPVRGFWGVMGVLSRYLLSFIVIYAVICLALGSVFYFLTTKFAKVGYDWNYYYNVYLPENDAVTLIYFFILLGSFFLSLMALRWIEQRFFPTEHRRVFRSDIV